MKFFILITTILTIVILPNAHAQYKEIKAGEQVPDFTFTDIYNSNQKVIHLSDYKGKLVILDFWGTYCAPCLKAFPFLDSLQKEYEGRIQILTIAAISRREMQSYFKKYIHVFKPNLPFIGGAKFMDTVFPHTGVPFQVWISPSGKVLLHGDPSDLTRKNIDNTLKSGRADYRKATKNIYTSLFDSRWKDLVAYSSTITRFRSDSLYMQTELNSTRKQLAERGSISFLYQRAFSDSAHKFLDIYSPGRIILNVRDTSQYLENPSFHRNEYLTWAEKNYYAYQLIEPDNFTGNMYQKMREDLDNFFQLASKVEKRMVESYVLVAIGDTDIVKTKGGSTFNNFYRMIDIHSTETAKIRSLKNQPFKYFSNIIRDLAEYGLKKPFFDETGIEGNVDMEVNGSVLDKRNLNDWQVVLKKYHLKLISKQKLIDVLVLSENN